MISNGFDSWGVVGLQRHATSERPGSENQVRVANRMVRVQMRNENNAQVCRLQSGDSSVGDSGLGAPHDAGAEVNQVWRAIYDDSRRRSRAVRVRGRVSRSE